MIRPDFAKAIRTIQSELHFLKDAKDTYYYYSRKLRRQPHDPDFNALKFIRDDIPGCYIDVGANQGQSIESIRLFRPRAQIHAFEANPILAEKLLKRYSMQGNIQVIPYGLSDCEQTSTLHLPIYKKFQYDGLASFDKDSAVNWLSADTVYWFSPKDLHIEEVSCHTKRLDGFKLSPVFIKIDVQGYEYNVVKSGIETIKEYEPILMIEDFFRSEPLANLLRDIGYQQYRFSKSGFYRDERTDVVNTILMTQRRESDVRMAGTGD